MREGMRELGIRLGGHGPILPWVIGESAAAVSVAGGLRSVGFDVRAIRPPSVPPETARLRHDGDKPSHTPEDIDAFLHAVKQLRHKGAFFPGRRPRGPQP